MTINPADTSTWLPLNSLAEGFDANKAVPTSDLAGRTVTVVNDGGVRVEHVFTADEVTHTFHPGDGSEPSTHTDSYEAVVVDDDLYYVQFHEHANPQDAISLFLDDRAGRALTVITSIRGPEQVGTRVQQAFLAGTIEGASVSGKAAAATTSLIGRRAIWTYSEQHTYEHIYLSPRWYAWQCLSGPERGLGDTDEASTYELRPGIYVFTWREKVIPCAAVTVADHRDMRMLRSHGALFGLDASGEQPSHFTFGAYGRVLSTTVHPAEFDPAMID